MFASYLRRGIAAGLLAGLLAGLFAFFFGEPTVDGAIQLEEAAAAGQHEEEVAGGRGHEEEEEVFSRSTQKVGLFFATGLSGMLVGGIFGMAYAYFGGRLASGSEWIRSLSLAGALFVGAFLIPFLKYPANPPTVGDPATIGSRTTAYFALVALSLLVVLGAWYAARTLRERGVAASARQLAVGLGVVVAVGVLFLVLPAGPDPGEFPAGLLWDFRLSSLGTQLVLWAGIGVIFGLLCERANRREPLAS
ncbi:MAG: CbtA family protein [Actinomycetota bacterium]|nr:CbtA family protein [Actinomycetota bacterium]